MQTERPNHLGKVAITASTSLRQKFSVVKQPALYASNASYSESIARLKNRAMHKQIFVMLSLGLHNETLPVEKSDNCMPCKIITTN
jgi:hypothetical protein